MSGRPTGQRRAWALAAPLVLGLSLGLLAGTPQAQASTVLSPTQGSGNLVVFDAAAGTGGWVGALDGFVHPDSGDALPLVSVVLFQWDALARTLSGSFELTAANDLASSLSGLLSGTAAEPDILNTGGQLSLDYTVLDGSGVFAGSTGFGLSFLDFNPLAVAADNYAETGLFVTSRAVPAPGSLPLALAGLLAKAVVVRPRAVAAPQALPNAVPPAAPAG